MLALAAVPTAYSGPSPLLASVRSSQPQMMAKSKSLPWLEAPAHLQGMVGNADFDPWGLSTPQNIKWMREAELKHGRMTMLAWTGYVAVDLGLKLPGAKYAALTSYTAHQVCVCPCAMRLLSPIAHTGFPRTRAPPVSYTHLTLPTKA